MRTFRDNAGRVWSLSISVGAHKRCLAHAGVDLYSLFDEGFGGLAGLVADMSKLFDVLYVLCRDEADKAGITADQFFDAMAGDVIQHARDAFLAELTDFFPDPRLREGIRGVIEKGRQVEDLVRAEFKERLAAVDPVAEARRLTARSGTSPAPSGSTPAPSLIGNST